MSSCCHKKRNTEADRTLLMPILHFMNESNFNGEYWDIIAGVLSKQEAKHYSTGRCWSRYTSLMFEARQSLLPNPTGDTVEAASDPEFEDDSDIEAALANMDGSDIQPAQHETQNVKNAGPASPIIKEQNLPISYLKSTWKRAGVAKNRGQTGKSKTTVTARKQEQRQITTWMARK